MGLDFGFNIAKRYKDTTVNELYMIEQYICWKKYNTEHYTLEEYLDEFCDGAALPSEDKIAFYEKEYERLGNTYDNYCNYCGWDNSFISEQIAGELNQITEGVYEGVTVEVIDKLLSWIDTLLEKNRLIPYQIVSGIKQAKNDEEAVIKLSGLIVENDEEERLVIPVGEYTTVYIPTKEYDEYKKGILEALNQDLYNLKKTDFEQNIVWFYVSY